MQILIGCAKTMTEKVPVRLTEFTEPIFQNRAKELASNLMSYNLEELQSILKVNKKIAKQNWLRYQNFDDLKSRIPAVFGYDGMVFKKLEPESWSISDLEYANCHLSIGSYLYGILRPLDLINPYRLEGFVELPASNYKSLFNYWQPILTNWFIEKIKNDDGVLVNLASNEFRDIFDWNYLQKEINVITPEFKVEKNGNLKTVVVYAKMCRGAMSRWIIKNRINRIDDLKSFEYEGFQHYENWLYAMNF